MIATLQAAQARRSRWAVRIAIFAWGLLALAYAVSY